MDSEKRSTSAIHANLAAASSGRLRLLLGLMAFFAVVWAVSRPYIAGLRRKQMPQPASTVLSRGDALLARGVEMAEHRRWLEAVEIIDSAAHYGVNNVALHRALGRCLGELGWVQDAIQEYERAVQQEPSYFNTYI